MNMKLTQWYPGHIKPVRNGVYQQMSGFGVSIGYQHWNGKRWGVWFATLENASKRRSGFASSAHQNDKWRGIAK